MSLTEASYYFRKYLPFAVVAFLILLIVFYIFKLLFIYLGTLSQPKTISYYEIQGIEGFKLEKPQFFDNKLATSSQDLKYVLDNPEGRPIDASSAAYVYYVPPTAGKIENKTKAENIAAQPQFGFAKSTMKKVLNSKEYKYTFSDMYRKLDIDLTNFNFTYKYEMKRNKQLFTKVKIPSETAIKDAAIDFLKKIDKYPEELAQGTMNIIYINYSQSTDTSTVVKRSKDANLVEVDFFRADISVLKVVTPTYFNSQNYVIFIPTEDGNNLMSAQVRFFAKSDDLTGVYALKTGEEAWQNLATGSANVVYNGSDKKTITIRKMELHYYDPDVYQQTIQPVYVFLGDNFAAYVPALKESYY